MSKCVVLVPVGSHVEPDAEKGLRALEDRGYVVRRVHGYAAIDLARNRMAYEAIEQGFDELLWIDSDVSFDPDDVTKLREHDLPIVCGIYPKKGLRAVSCHVMPGTTSMTFGKGGGLVEVLHAATGFLLTRREVYERMTTELKLPLCNARFKEPFVPYFMPMIVEEPEGSWYLGEDYAFCERARKAGFKIMADTTIRLRHIGKYGYSWEDAGGALSRYATFHLKLT